MATVGITKLNDASIGTRLETHVGPVAEFYKRCSQGPGCKRKFWLGGMDWAKGMWNIVILHFQDHYDCKGGKKGGAGGRGKEKRESYLCIGSTLQSCILKAEAIATCIQ